MGQYEFTLRFALGQPDSDPELFVDKLLAEGCDEAIFNALSDVQRAIPEARLVEAAPDLVGLTDIARLLGFSRQNMRKLVIKKGSAFPPPVHEGKPAIWHLATVLSWFIERKNRHFDQSIIDVSRINMQCDILRETAKLDRDISSRLKNLIAWNSGRLRPLKGLAISNKN